MASQIEGGGGPHLQRELTVATRLGSIQWMGTAANSSMVDPMAAASIWWSSAAAGTSMADPAATTSIADLQPSPLCGMDEVHEEGPRLDLMDATATISIGLARFFYFLDRLTEASGQRQPPRLILHLW